MTEQNPIYDFMIPVFTRMLTNMERFMTKSASYADSKKFEVDVLLNSRLAPDQFNFIRQVQITCDVAKSAAARLSGQTPPVHEDKEKTLPELKQRIQTVLTYLKTFKPSDFNNWENQKVSMPFFEGKHLTGKDYYNIMVMPNFYFHMTTAYAILRNNGVDVGKQDFLGDLPLKG